MASPRKEEYLESIFRLQQKERPVRISKLAEDLGITLASASEMAKKLKQMKLISNTGKKVYLTKRGETEARQVIRRHRLSERLLTDVLGFDWDKVHEEACKLEHALSQELEDGIAESLGNPETCPHGQPIPNKDGVFVEESTLPLSSLEPGEKREIARVPEDNPELLRYLDSLGLKPKVEVEVKEVAPFGGPLLIQIGNVRHALGQRVASKILVKADDQRSGSS